MSETMNRINNRKEAMINSASASGMPFMGDIGNFPTGEIS